MLLFHSIAYASQDTPALSPQLIKQWMTSQKALEEWGNQNEDKIQNTETKQPSSPFDLDADSMITPLKDAGLYNEANKLVKNYGFTNIEQWANITLRITMAAAAIEISNQPELSDLSELTKLKNNPQISEQQREIIEQAITHNTQMVEQIKSATTPGDMSAVKPLLSDILKLMEEP